MGAVMQCLANCELLLQAVLQSNHWKGCTLRTESQFQHSTAVNCAYNSRCVQCAFEICILQMNYPSTFFALDSETPISAEENDSTMKILYQCYGKHPLIHIIKILPFISLEFGRQEDAHEFLMNLLRCVEKSEIVNSPLHLANDSVGHHTSSNDNGVNPYSGCIFGSSLRSYVTCFDCRTTTTQSECIQDIQLEISKAGSLQTAMNEHCK